MRRECSGDGDDGREPSKRPAHWTTDKGKARAKHAICLPLEEDQSVRDFMFYGMGFLPLPWLLMVLSTCKSFAKLKGSSPIDQLACRCLCASFPRSVTGVQYLPDIGFSDALRVYKEYLFDVSTENSLFSARGTYILDQWLESTSNSVLGRAFSNNLPFDLAVLRKGGFFFSLYSRGRLVQKLQHFIDWHMHIVMKMTVNIRFLPHINQLFARGALGSLMKMEYLRKLALSSFAVSNSPIYSNHWKTVAMHDMNLPKPANRWHVDIDQRDVEALYLEFDDCLMNPDRTKIERVFDSMTSESQRGYILHNLKNSGVEMFPRYHFSMDPDFQAYAWHTSPYHNFSLGLNDVGSEFNEFWRIYMRLCRQSRSLGGSESFRPDLGRDWMIAVLGEVDLRQRPRLNEQLFRFQAYFDGFWEDPLYEL
jgi:hypothetical protein